MAPDLSLLKSINLPIGQISPYPSPSKLCFPTIILTPNSPFTFITLMPTSPPSHHCQQDPLSSITLTQNHFLLITSPPSSFFPCHANYTLCCHLRLSNIEVDFLHNTLVSSSLSLSPSSLFCLRRHNSFHPTKCIKKRILLLQVSTGG